MFCLNTQGHSGVDLTFERTDALVAQSHGNEPCVAQAAGFCTEHSAKARSVGYEEEKSPTLRAGVVPAALCARLQGFPDWWCRDLGTDAPSEADMAFWRDVFETHRRIVGTASKPKTDNQIVKWLKNPHTDAAEYRLWGNGIALPCAYFVLSGIVWTDAQITV